jgi:hypothetical protein
MKINHNAEIKIDHNTTFGDIYDAVVAAEIPPTAKVSVDKYVGDQRDPGYSHIKFAWETGS